MLSARKIHNISLTREELQQIRTLIRKGIANARTITRARVLLMADDGRIDKEIYQALSLAVSTPYDIRKRYREGGLQRALFDLPRPGQKRRLTGAQEAEVVAIACAKAPKGYVRWTLDLLTEEVNAKMGVSIVRTAIWKVLLRNDTKPWLKKMWCIPKVTPEFKKQMLDILAVYQREGNTEIQALLAL